ncbi:MAG: CPBP family intramembrane metalloprotease [Acidimicrobiia bacterium]|nr:CPBP family intramembrane metalloprotease [Acidimicrobiia bacterium]
MSTRPLPGWPPRRPEVRWGLREAILCLLAVQVAAAFWMAMTQGAVTALGADSEGIDVLLLGTVGLWMGYFLGPALISRFLGRGPGVDFDIGVRLPEAAVAVAVGLGLQLVALPLLYWPISRLVDGDPGARARELVDMIEGPMDVVLLALAVVLIAPVVEERFYRGLLLPSSVAAVGPVAGTAGTSLIFALVHQDLILVPGLMLLAVILSVMTASTGRIGPAVVAHMSFNATTVVRLLLLG